MKNANQKKEVVSFRRTMAPNENITLEERVKADGTIERVRARFYEGQELKLEIRPFIRHKGNKMEDVITYANDTKNVISGNDDEFEFDVTISVEYDDFICVSVHNTDSVNSYTLVVDYDIDYYGGSDRVVGGVM